MKLVVGPASLEAAIAKSAQIYSSDEKPPPEYEPRVLTQLIDETETAAQHLLANHLPSGLNFPSFPLPIRGAFKPTWGTVNSGGVMTSYSRSGELPRPISSSMHTSSTTALSDGNTGSQGG